MSDQGPKETIKVASSDFEGGFTFINAEDFDHSIHTEFGTVLPEAPVKKRIKVGE
jgi:hypothetical protein